MFNRVSLRQTFVVLASLCFLLAIAVVAYHHHDTSFQSRTCTICKVKTSLSGGSSKAGLDPMIASSDDEGTSANVPLSCLSRITTECSVFLTFSPLHPHSNKAPPFHS